MKKKVLSKSDKEKLIIENFSETFNKIKRDDDSEISLNESFHEPDGTPIGVDSNHRPIKEKGREMEKIDDGIDVEFDIKDDIVHLISNTPPYENIGTYKISTDSNYSVSPAEKRTHWHPGGPSELEDAEINLQLVAIQIFDDGRREKVELPIEHFSAIEKAIEDDLQYGFDNWTDTTYFKVPEDPEDGRY